MTGDANTVRILFASLAAVVVTVLCVGITFLFLNVTDPIRRRLGNIRAADLKPDARGRQLVSFDSVMGPIARYVVPKEEVERSDVVKKLVRAGFAGPQSVQNYFAIRAVLLILLPAIVLFVTEWIPNMPTSTIFIFTACAAGVGYIGPSFVVDRLLEKRQTALRKGFPDALDLMVVCIESGLGLAQSIKRVSDELAVSQPELASELGLVNAEMRAGVENIVALKNLSDRTGLDDIKGLVSTLVQTLRFGTSVADALRIYAEDFRDKRMQDAEERAAKMGTKMIFPLVLFMFPGFFVVAIGPAVIQMIRVFTGL